MLGDTNIVLIPKYNQPRTVRDLGLVFLCNLVYKILVKTMATRLQKVLGTCISIQQSSFVAVRPITDNIYTVSDNSLSEMQDSETLKNDISKAYDRVDLNYLLSIMEKMSFNLIWIKWMCICVIMFLCKLMHKRFVL